MSQLSQCSIFGRGLNINNNYYGRPSTQGEELNMGASSKLSSYESMRKSKRSIKTAVERENDNDFKFNVQPIRMSLFFNSTQRESLKLPINSEQNIQNSENCEKNTNLNTPTNNNKKIDQGALLMRFRLLNQEKKKSLDLEQIKEKNKERIKTVYVNNTQSDIKFIENSKNKKNPVLLRKNYRYRAKKKGTIVNRTLNSDLFCLDEKFKSQVVEKSWPEHILKEYQKKLKEKIKLMQKEITQVK